MVTNSTRFLVRIEYNALGGSRGLDVIYVEGTFAQIVIELEQTESPVCSKFIAWASAHERCGGRAQAPAFFKGERNLYEIIQLGE